MKKALLVLVFSAVLMGYSNDYTDEINKHIETMKEQSEMFAVGNGDYVDFQAAIEDFNNTLEAIDSDDQQLNGYIELQLETNEMRLAAFKSREAESISKSTLKQAQALDIWNQIKND
ncbi:hypothetical protein [Sediminibacillus massiliensis]|uniref:hypothetical protein n=1 Tax=Sediminibacillus massiliensis TaxID=1926277 RepID=UPI0009885E51|nr:hypothetical protein [Sediminibacillus massiliensis]